MESSATPLIWPKITYGQEHSEPTTIYGWLAEIEKEIPRISTKLSLLIGHKEFEIAMNELMIDSRGDRQGFSKHMLKCLFELSKAHTEKYGVLIPTTGVWNI